jgi:3-oxoacyl-[acyl-carrier protein] reductase
LTGGVQEASPLQYSGYRVLTDDAPLTCDLSFRSSAKFFLFMVLSRSHVLVTGASGRLGSILIRALVEAGSDVTSLGRTRPADSSIEHIDCDVLDESSMRAAIARAGKRQAPTALIHAVGTWGETPLDSPDVGAWRDLLDINLMSTVICFRAAIDSFGSGSRLVAFASGQGADRGVAGQSAYAAAKAGVIRLVESADAELKDRGIRAFAIAPSMILYGDESDGGVHASDLATLCVDLLKPEAAALGGSVIRAYG